MKTIAVSDNYHEYIKLICKKRKWTMEKFHDKFMESIRLDKVKSFYNSLPDPRVNINKPLSNTKIDKFYKNTMCI